ncbi:MAG: HEPN domain-containing protein [Syntrophothermus sp.]
MKREHSKEGQRWFEQARRDLDDANFVRNGGRYNLACFLAQQAAEKALKAFLYNQGAEQVWGHSVIELCTDASDFDPAFSKIKSDGAALDKYYIPTRYPDGLPGGIPANAYQKDDADLAIEKATKIISFVEERL